MQPLMEPQTVAAPDPIAREVFTVRVVNVPAAGVVPPIVPGEGNEDVDPPSDTEVPPMVIALLTRPEFGIDGRSPATSEHGAKVVTLPHVPRT